MISIALDMVIITPSFQRVVNGCNKTIALEHGVRMDFDPGFGKPGNYNKATVMCPLQLLDRGISLTESLLHVSECFLVKMFSFTTEQMEEICT